MSRVGEGWDNEAYLVDGTWIFRFPRNAEQAPWIAREIAIMPVIADALGPLVPRFEKLGSASDAFPYSFVGYRRIDGVGADTIELSDPRGLATDIADAYTRLHAIDTSSVPRTPDAWEDETWHDWRSHHPEDMDDLREILPANVRERAEPFIAGSAEPPPSGPRRVVHNDICADHVLVDTATGRLSGLIDWGDVMVGDPVLDFIGLIQIGSWHFVRDVVRHYGGETDPAFFDRMVWGARTLSLHWLVDVLEEDGAPDAHLLWVARAFDEP